MKHFLASVALFLSLVFPALAADPVQGTALRSTNGWGIHTTLYNSTSNHYFTNASGSAFAIDRAPDPQFSLAVDDGILAYPNAFGVVFDGLTGGGGGGVYAFSITSADGGRIGNQNQWSVFGDGVGSITLESRPLSTPLTNMGFGAVSYRTNGAIGFTAGVGATNPKFTIQNRTNGPANLEVKGVYHGDGSGLTNIGSSAVSAALTNYDTRSLVLTNGNTFRSTNVWSKQNLKFYGAVGDGVTDDSSALIKAMVANVGGKVLVDPGYTFLVSNIPIRDSTTLEGAKGAPAANASKFLCTSGHMFISTNATAITNPRFTGLNLVTSGAGVDVFHITNTITSLRIDNVCAFIGSTTSHIIYFHGPECDLGVVSDFWFSSSGLSMTVPLVEYVVNFMSGNLFENGLIDAGLDATQAAFWFESPEAGDSGGYQNCFRNLIFESTKRGGAFKFYSMENTSLEHVMCIAEALDNSLGNAQIVIDISPGGSISRNFTLRDCWIASAGTSQAAVSITNGTTDVSFYNSDIVRGKVLPVTAKVTAQNTYFSSIQDTQVVLKVTSLLPYVDGGATIGAGLYLATNGNVGVNTPTPGGTLPSGWTSSAFDRSLEINTSAAGASSGSFLRRFNGVTGFDRWNDGQITGFSFLDDRFDNVAGAMNFRMRTAGTPITAMTIRGSGNIGIGNTNPVAQLDVAGQVWLTNTTSASPSGYTGLQLSPGSNGVNANVINVLTNGTSTFNVTESGNTTNAGNIQTATLNTTGAATIAGAVSANGDSTFAAGSLKVVNSSGEVRVWNAGKLGFSGSASAATANYAWFSSPSAGNILVDTNFLAKGTITATNGFVSYSTNYFPSPNVAGFTNAAAAQSGGTNILFVTFTGFTSGSMEMYGRSGLNGQTICGTPWWTNTPLLGIQYHLGANCGFVIRSGVGISYVVEPE